MLDLVFTDNDDATESVLTSADVGDHLPVHINIPDNLTINEGPKKRFWSYSRAEPICEEDH